MRTLFRWKTQAFNNPGIVPYRLETNLTALMRERYLAISRQGKALCYQRDVLDSCPSLINCDFCYNMFTHAFQLSLGIESNGYLARYLEVHGP